MSKRALLVIITRTDAGVAQDVIPLDEKEARQAAKSINGEGGENGRRLGTTDTVVTALVGSFVEDDSDDD